MSNFTDKLKKLNLTYAQEEIIKKAILELIPDEQEEVVRGEINLPATGWNACVKTIRSKL